MKTPSQILINQFVQRLEHNYEQYCQSVNVEASFKNFLAYLIDHNLLSEPDIRKYTVLDVYQLTNQTEQIKNTNLVRRISQKFSISNRTVWSILQKTNEKPNE